MKILYLSCHSIHEYDEVRMLHELGHEVVIPGRLQPEIGFAQRPPIPGFKYNEEQAVKLNNYYTHLHENNLGGDPIESFSHLTPDLVEEFDVIFVMCLFIPWISKNWDVIKNKIIIWRTNGQSCDDLEHYVKVFIKDKPNIKIVRYSPAERNYNFYAGEDALIRFGKKPEEWKDWSGNNQRVISLCQNVIGRAKACSWDIINYVGSQVPYTLFGQTNIGNPYWSGEDLSYNDVTTTLRDNRCYLYNGTKPACYTLNFIEAWMTGIPVVALGPILGNNPNYKSYEIHELIENGVSGFYSDNKDELINYCKLLLEDSSLANKISSNGRQQAIELFGYSKILQQWKEFLNNL